MNKYYVLINFCHHVMLSWWKELIGSTVSCFLYSWCSDICGLADQGRLCCPALAKGSMGAFHMEINQPRAHVSNHLIKVPHIRPILPHALNRRRARYQTTRDSPYAPESSDAIQKKNHREGSSPCFPPSFPLPLDTAWCFPVWPPV